MLGKMLGAKIIKDQLDQNLTPEQKKILSDPNFAPDVVDKLGKDAKISLVKALTKMKKGVEWMGKLKNPRDMAIEFQQGEDKRKYDDRLDHKKSASYKEYADARGIEIEKDSPIHEIILRVKNIIAQRITGGELIEDPELAKMRDNYTEVLRNIILQRIEEEEEELPKDLNDIIEENSWGTINSDFYNKLNPQDDNNERSINFLKDDEGFTHRAEAMIAALNNPNTNEELQIDEE